MIMGKQFYIADWHYNHANCIAFDNRPFKSVQEMNEELVERWNKAVSNDDTVYILGDMFWCNWKDALPVLDKLHGNKILIKGNHDRCNESQFVKKFSKIVDYLEFVIPYYIKEARTQLIIGIGCTGGKHRSVVLTEEIATRLNEHGHNVQMEHRDISKK